MIYKYLRIFTFICIGSTVLSLLSNVVMGDPLELFDLSVRSTNSQTQTVTEKPKQITYHIIAIPHVHTPNGVSEHDYAQKVVDICRNLWIHGQRVIHYGHPDSKVPCTDHVAVHTRELFEKVYDSSTSALNRDYEHNDPVYKTFKTNTIIELRKRLKSGDIIICFSPHGHRRIVKTFASYDAYILGPIF